MINIPRLSHLADTQRFDRMLDEVARNGRPLPLAVRLRLSHAQCLPGAALGLALQRVCELTYRPTEASIRLLEGLLEARRDDGSFGPAAATAVALAALCAVVHQLDALPGRASPRFIDEELERRARAAVPGAIAWLAALQDDGDEVDLFDESHGLVGDEVDSAIVLWQLGFEPRFTGAIRFADLLDAVDAHGLRHDRSTAQLVGRFDAGAGCLRLQPAA